MKIVSVCLLSLTLVAPGLIAAEKNISSHSSPYPTLGSIERLDPALVDFELDVGWASAAGVDCRALLDRLGKRVRLLHLKDIEPRSDAFSMHSADCGTGVVRWSEIIPAIQRQKISHLFLEQEPPLARPALDSARVSYQFLSQALSTSV